MSTRKPPRGSSSRPAPSSSHRAPRSGAAATAPVEEPKPYPADADPETQAKYFLQLLDTLAQTSDPTAADIRYNLVAMIAEYRDTKQAGDVEKARVILAARVAALEVALFETLLKYARKIRDRVIDQSRRLGTSSAKGKTLRHSAEVFAHLTDALQLQLEAVRSKDLDLREQARRELDKAKAAFEALKAV